MKLSPVRLRMSRGDIGKDPIFMPRRAAGTCRFNLFLVPKNSAELLAAVMGLPVGAQFAAKKLEPLHICFLDAKHVNALLSEFKILDNSCSDLRVQSPDWAFQFLPGLILAGYLAL